MTIDLKTFPICVTHHTDVGVINKKVVYYHNDGEGINVMTVVFSGDKPKITHKYIRLSAKADRN